MLIIKDSDHRKFPRRRFTARVAIRDHIHGRQNHGTAIDINPMGLFLETRRTFTLGEIVSLRFGAPGGDYDVALTGEVVRVVTGDDGQRPGVAIEFFGHEDWIFEELCSYVYEGEGARQLIATLDTTPPVP